MRGRPKNRRPPVALASSPPVACVRPSDRSVRLHVAAQTSYERKEAEWRQSQITIKKGGGDLGGNIDNWMAKQNNN